MNKLFYIALVALLTVFVTGQGFAQRGMNRQKRFAENSLKVGDLAPSFKLKSLDGKSETDLQQYRGKKPVVLFFGSYT